eukprot:Phypoly_transcript_16333.p1 GENE.Phypoly_transcript_16333~~Phypoly_transcript_16333.p1  ORF type:complete len:238 (+),score=33.35 Phypoly_transcript_16333:127-840(+)
MRLPISWPHRHVKYLPFSLLHSSLHAHPFNLLETQTNLLSSHTTIVPITRPNHPAFGQFGLTATRTLAKGTFLANYTGFITTHPPHTSAYIFYLLTTNLQNNLQTNLQNRVNLQQINANLQNQATSQSQNSYFLDAQEGGNETRFLNDYRGTGEEQNVCFVRVVRGMDGCVRVKVVGDGVDEDIVARLVSESEKSVDFGDEEGTVGGLVVSVRVMVVRDVAVGGELLCDYGPTFWAE